MGHDSSFNKQLRIEIKARAVMNKKIGTLQADIDEINLKNHDVVKEIITIQRAIRKRKQKDGKHHDLFLRVTRLKNLRTEIRNKIDAL